MTAVMNFWRTASKSASACKQDEEEHRNRLQTDTLKLLSSSHIPMVQS